MACGLLARWRDGAENTGESGHAVGEAGAFVGDRCGRWRVGADLMQKKYRSNERKNRSLTRCLAGQD